MNLSQWKTEFLSKNGRSDLIGSPLYAYKMSEHEFCDLKNCLQDNIASYLNVWDVNEVLSKSSAIPELFVLYAAIWWQREYDGTGMAWEPIFSSIGINSDTINSTTRSTMVENGLRYWKIELNQDIGNLKFIGNIASQGGLPLKLIATGHGILNTLLKRVLKDVVNLAFPDQASILSIIESHKTELQKSYRQPLIYNLLSEIIITFVHLKEEAKLSGSSNPLEKLDQYKANWRDSFPLPMDDENARGVLERFIQEGVRIKAERPAFKLSLNRYIQFSDINFKVSSRLDLPKQNIDEESIKKVFDIDDGFITRMMQLLVSNHQETYEIVIRKLAGQSNYRFDSDGTQFFRHAHHEHFAILKNDNNSRRDVILADGFELDDDIPWIFDASDEAGEGKFLKVGAGKFKSAQLFVVVPASFNLSIEIEPLAWSHDNEKKCYLVSESLTFLSADGESYLITPNSSDASDEEFGLTGNRLWQVFQKPAVAFTGFPQVIKYISTTPTHKKAIPINALCRNLENKVLSPNLAIYGPLNLTVKELNSNVWASKIVVLPSDASYKLFPGDDTNHGTILLSRWHIQNIKCLDNNVALDVKSNSTDTTINCVYNGTEAPNELINLELFWPNNPKTAIIQLPFPSTGVIAFDESGHRLHKNETLALHELYGVRVVSLLSQSNFVEIELNLKDSGDIKIEPICIRLKRDINNARVEIRLIDFKEQISDLLYANDHIDSKVEFRVKIVGAKDFVLFITKYDIEFEHRTGVPTFMIKQSHLANYSNEIIENCEVIATRIDEIDDIVTLNQSISEGVYNGIWQFPVYKYPSGCWIVHPSSQSTIQFRSMVLPLGNKNNDIDVTPHINLSYALNIADNEERLGCINKVLNELIQDFNHKDWLHIEYLANHLGHLNLTSLDIWRFFARNKHAMAALVLRDSNFPEHFVQRFSTELPFLWEFVSLDAWLDAAFYLKKQLHQKNDNETFAEQYFEYLLASKLNSLLVSNPSLNMMFEIIKHKNNLEINQELQGVLGHPKIYESVLFNQLFTGEQSDLQNLMRREDEDWPSKFSSEIRAYKRSEHQSLLCQQDYGFKESVINFPFIIAINSLTEDLPVWLGDEHLFLDIKKIKNFDQDWFASAFDKTIARAITKGYIQL